MILRAEKMRGGGGRENFVGAAQTYTLTQEKFITKGKGMSEYIITEEELAKRIGLHRKVVKNTRRSLQEGRDWCLTGGMIQYTRDGLKRITELLGFCEKNAAPQGEEAGGKGEEAGGKGEEAGGKGEEARAGEGGTLAGEIMAMVPYRPQVIEVKVVKFFTNRRILGCENATGEIIRVMVPKADNFKKNMMLPCKQVQADLYELVGRCPRMKGRW